MRWRVLGAVEAVGDDGRPVTIGSPNQRIVLATLLAHAGDVVSFDGLCEAVWGATPPDSAVTSLRTYVSRLRKLAGGSLVTRGAGYVLDVAPDDVDAGRFERLVGAADGLPPAAAADLLREALELWRGPAFGAEAHLPGVRAEAVRLEERRGAARAQLAEALLRAGRPGDAVAELEALVADEPVRERAWVLLVDSLAADGRTADGLRAVRRAGDALAAVGLVPSPSMRDVERRILAVVDHAGPDPAGAPSRGQRMVGPPHHAAPLIGRVTDLNELTALLRRARIVTLVGPGGVGKSRLAAELTHLVAETMDVPVAWVGLSDLPGDVHAIAEAVASAVGLTTHGVDARDVIDGLGSIDVVVVLDDAEHAIDAVGAIVRRIVTGGPRARVVVTSREALDIDGEHVWPVGPLPTEPSGAAVQLLAERARAAAPAADLSRTSLLRSIVERLDGLPLAIEMAAARLATSSLTELDADLDGALADLDAGRRSPHARHRSLAAVIEWSERSLQPDDREVFEAMSVFAGPVAGADVEAAVGERSVVRLRELARRSLVTVDTSAPPTRFGLLGVIRAHTARRLGDDRRRRLLSRHAGHFAAVAVDVDRLLRSGDEVDAVERLDRSFAELRAAHRFGREHDDAAAVAISGALQATARSRMLDEVFHWGEDLADAGDTASPPAAALIARAARSVARGELDAAASLVRRALDGTTDTTLTQAGLELLGDVGVFGGDTDVAIEAYGEGLALAREEDDQYYIGLHGCGCAVAHLYAGRRDDAHATMRALDAALDRFGPTPTAWVHYSWGEILADTDPVDALARFDRAAEVAGAVRSRFVERMALVSSTALRARVGDVARSAAAFTRIIAVWNDTGDRTHQLTTLRNLAVLLHRAEQPELVATLVGALRDAPVATYGDEARRLADAWEYAEEQLGDARAAELATAQRHRDVFDTARWALEQLHARF